MSDDKHTKEASLLPHCCDCAKSEDAREMVAIAVAFMQEARPGETFDAADDLIVTAFKSERAKYGTAGLPRFDVR